MKNSNKYLNPYKMSKKIVLMLAIAIMPMLSFGQSIFDKFEDIEDVTSVVVNKKMISMIASIDLDLDDPEAQQLFETAKKITGIKVFTTGNETVSKDMNATVSKYLKKSSLEELMRVKDGGQTVKFYVKEGRDENHVKELLMFISGLKEITKGEDITINGKKREVETVLVSIVGDIDLRQISKITNKMKVPGGEHLEKAGKSKNKK